MHLLRYPLPGSLPSHTASLGTQQLLALGKPPPGLQLHNWAKQPHARNCSIVRPFSDLNETHHYRAWDLTFQQLQKCKRINPQRQTLTHSKKEIGRIQQCPNLPRSNHLLWGMSLYTLSGKAHTILHHPCGVSCPSSLWRLRSTCQCRTLHCFSSSLPHFMFVWFFLFFYTFAALSLCFPNKSSGLIYCLRFCLAFWETWSKTEDNLYKVLSI